MQTPSFNNLHQMFLNAMNNIHHPGYEWLFYKENEKYNSITFGDADNYINNVSNWLLNEKFSTGDVFAFLTENCPAYFLMDMALQQIGMINASIYPTLSESEVTFVFNDSEAKGIIIGSPFLLKKIKKIHQNLHSLRKIVVLFPDAKDIWDDPRIVRWDEIIESDLSDQNQKRLLIRETINHNHIATLLYTSGTTGNPKGAILTHGNFILDAASGLYIMHEFTEHERFLSFLPLCHVFERCVSLYIGLYKGSQVAFAESIEKIASNIGEIQPTVMATVPRLLEKIESKVKKNIEDKGGFSKSVFLWALNNGEKRYLLNLKNKKPDLLLSLQLWMAEKLVFSKIKKKLGGRIHFIVSGGAALPEHVAVFFAAIGIKVLEGYGLTETSPFITVNELNRQIIGTVGRIGPWQEVAIQNPDSGEIYTVQNYNSFNPEFESQEGEILMKGPNLMNGYWKQPDQTKKVIDAQGWFHTGDIGKFYKGNLKITDRLKNIIVNSYGKNIYPTQVENVYLKSPAIEQIFIIGDKRDCLTAIIVPAPEWLLEKGTHIDDDTAIKFNFISDEMIRNEIHRELKKFEKELAKFERVKAFIIKSKPFSIENGEMTPKQSIRRKIVEEKYAEDINKMYLEIIPEED